jgi:hypothetical protein
MPCKQQSGIITVLFPIRSVAENSLLAFSFWSLHFNLIVSLVVIISRLLLETAYGIGGCWVTWPFLHSESFNSMDLGLELIANSMCWQSGVVSVSIKRLNALLDGRLRSWLVGQTNFATCEILIPLSPINRDAIKNDGSFLVGLLPIANALR